MRWQGECSSAADDGWCAIEGVVWRDAWWASGLSPPYFAVAGSGGVGDLCSAGDGAAGQDVGAQAALVGEALDDVFG